MGKSSKQKTVKYKGITYIGIMKSGKVCVRSERTAHGQNLLVGVYDPTASTWQNRSNLPIFVKKEMEYAFTA